MDSLPTIPTPPSQRWREFKVQVLPVIVFLMVMAMIAFMWKNFLQPGAGAGGSQPATANVSKPENEAAARLTRVAPAIDTKVASAGQ